MFISSVEEEIYLKCSDGTNGIFPIQEYPTISTHTTNVVPEKTQSDLSLLLSNLEGNFILFKFCIYVFLFFVY